MDPDRVEYSLAAMVGPVLARLQVLQPGLSTPMVVGAVCRDALHYGLGYETTLRATGDLDVALAVSDLAEYEELAAKLPPVPSPSGIRYRVADALVDLVPFGAAVEAPDGIVEPRRHQGAMSVFGFQDVYDTATVIALTEGPLRVPSVSGYALLKLKAWADRSQHGEYKDGFDLACSMHWYLDYGGTNELANSVRERLWTTDEGHRHLTDTGMDEGGATVRVLVADALAPLPGSRRLELRGAWDRVDDALLSAYLANDMLSGWPRRGDARLRRYVQSVRATVAAAR